MASVAPLRAGAMTRSLNRGAVAVLIWIAVLIWNAQHLWSFAISEYDYYEAGYMLPVLDSKS